MTQLRLEDEVLPDSSKVQRSKTTGALFVKMPLQNPARRIKAKVEKAEEELQPLQPDKPSVSLEDKEQRSVISGLGNLIGSVDLNIVNQNAGYASRDSAIRERKEPAAKPKVTSEKVNQLREEAKKKFVENSNVPPLD